MIKCEGFGYQPELSTSHYEVYIDKATVSIYEILNNIKNLKVSLPYTN